MLLAAPAAAQMSAPPTTLQAALAKDAGTLSDKFAGLAKVMAGKYDWKPGQGVRSAGDVFNLIVGENKMLAAAPHGRGGARPRHADHRAGPDAGGADQLLRRAEDRARRPLRRAMRASWPQGLAHCSLISVHSASIEASVACASPLVAAAAESAGPAPG